MNEIVGDALFELIAGTTDNVNLYRNPDTSRFKRAIDPILVALGEIPIGFASPIEIAIIDPQYTHVKPQVEMLKRSGGYLRIVSEPHVTNSARVVSHIPLDVLIAPNPIFEARRHLLRSQINEQEGLLKRAREDIVIGERKLGELRSQLADLEP